MRFAASQLASIEELAICCHMPLGITDPINDLLSGLHKVSYDGFPRTRSQVNSNEKPTVLSIACSVSQASSILPLTADCDILIRF